MATSVYTDFQVYDSQFQGGFVETLYQNTNAFNAASSGALRFQTSQLVGHYQREAFWDEVSSIARRDITSTGAATAVALTQDEFISVKLNRINGPYESTLDALRKIGRDSREFSRAIGIQTAKATPLEMIDRALAALTAKLESVAALDEDDTAATITTSGMVTALALAGDSAGEIVAWVMHSKPYYDLVGEQITNAIYRANGVRIMDGVPATLGRPVLVIDSTSLLDTDGVSTGVDEYLTLGLRAGAAEIELTESPVAVMEGPITGFDNLLYRWQSEYAYNISLKGCQWDTTNGGINPTNANVALATNWDTVVADNKGLPGVLLRTR